MKSRTRSFKEMIPIRPCRPRKFEDLVEGRRREPQAVRGAMGDVCTENVRALLHILVVAAGKGKSRQRCDGILTSGLAPQK